MSVHYDAIVIGSGISGGWAAKELTEKGLRVVMRERGRQVAAAQGYGNAHQGPGESLQSGGRQTRGGGSRRRVCSSTWAISL